MWMDCPVVPGRKDCFLLPYCGAYISAESVGQMPLTDLSQGGPKESVQALPSPEWTLIEGHRRNEGKNQTGGGEELWRA